MVYELSGDNYFKIKPLLKARPEMNVSIDAIIDGNNRGKIWIDDPEAPNTALVWAIGCAYLD